MTDTLPTPAARLAPPAAPKGPESQPARQAHPGAATVEITP